VFPNVSRECSTLNSRVGRPKVVKEECPMGEISGDILVCCLLGEG